MINYRYKIETSKKKTFWGVMPADNIISCIHQLSNGGIVGENDGRIIDISVKEESIVRDYTKGAIMSDDNALFVEGFMKEINKFVVKEPGKTFLDKYLEEGNDIGPRGIPGVCPHMLGYEEDFNCGRITCNECWNREIPV